MKQQEVINPAVGNRILTETQSICPTCHRPVKAYYITEDAGASQQGEQCCCCGESSHDAEAPVYFVKECPEHGSFRTLAAERAADYEAWVKNPVINIPPKAAMTQGDPQDQSCPLHCGTCENHLQTACCVLIDLTDRCNQHCPYCFAKAEMDADRSGEPTLEELEAKYDLLLELGEERPFNIQLSGGEPTVRDDLPEIIHMAKNKGFEYIQINSNGKRLALEEGYAQVLKDAGASVIFMQFDGTNDEIYQALRGEPLLEMKEKAIRNCEKAGLAVTLVPTMVEGVNTDNIGDMMDFLVENVNVVKGIHFQPVSFFGRHPEDGSGDFPGRISMFGVLRKLAEQRPEFAYEDFLPISTGHTLCCFYSTYTREPDGSVRCMLTHQQREEGVSCCDTTGCCDTVDCCDTAADQENPADLCSTTADCCSSQTSENSSDCCGSTIDCCGTSESRNAKQPAVSCCDMTQADQLEVIKKDRDFVLNRWEIAEPEQNEDPAGTEECCCCGIQPEAETSAESCCCSSEAETPQPEEPEIMDMDEFLRYYRQNTFTVTGMAFQDLTNLDAERVKRCRVQQLTPDNRLIPFCAYNTIYRETPEKA